MNNYRKPASWAGFYQSPHSICEWNNRSKSRRLKFGRTWSPKCNFSRVYSLSRHAHNWRKQNFNQNLRTYNSSQKHPQQTKNPTTTTNQNHTCGRKNAVRDLRINTVLIKLVSSSSSGRSFSVGIIWDPLQCLSSSRTVVIRSESCSSVRSFPSLFLPSKWILLNKKIKTQQGPSQALSQILKELAFTIIRSRECFYSF